MLGRTVRSAGGRESLPVASDFALVYDRFVARRSRPFIWGQRTQCRSVISFLPPPCFWENGRIHWTAVINSVIYSMMLLSSVIHIYVLCVRSGICL